jgi:hypothetical protein
MIFDGRQNDYQIFGIYENAEQANATCDKLEKSLRENDV